MSHIVKNLPIVSRSSVDSVQSPRSRNLTPTLTSHLTELRTDPGACISVPTWHTEVEAKQGLRPIPFGTVLIFKCNVGSGSVNIPSILFAVRPPFNPDESSSPRTWSKTFVISLIVGGAWTQVV